MATQPIGRVTSKSFFSPGGETPVQAGVTWMEAESFAYPAGGFTRRAYVRFDDGVLRVVRVSIADTWFTVPARARIKSKTIRGYVSLDSATEEFRFHVPQQWQRQEG